MWHYLSMGSWGSRLARIVALPLLAFAFVAPAAAIETAPPPKTGVVSTTPAASTLGTGEHGNTEKRPNVGDDAPGHSEFGEHRNLLTDESGLIALGLAGLVGAATAILVMRSQRKNSLY